MIKFVSKELEESLNSVLDREVTLAIRVLNIGKENVVFGISS